MNCLRIPKSPAWWTSYDLLSYNISVVSQTKQQFFGSTQLPPLTKPSMMAFAQGSPYGPYKGSLRQYMKFARARDPWSFGWLESFTNQLLRELGYDEYKLRRSPELPFPICGEPYTALLCNGLSKQDEIKGITCAFESRGDYGDPEAQTIANAIAAFVDNNTQRQKRNMPPLCFDMLPAIRMLDAQPVFYKIPISTDLTAAIARGVYSETETRVLKHKPEVAVKGVDDEGLYSLQNRKELMEYLLAFKKFLVR